MWISGIALCSDFGSSECSDCSLCSVYRIIRIQCSLIGIQISDFTTSEFSIRHSDQSITHSDITIQYSLNQYSVVPYQPWRAVVFSRWFTFRFICVFVYGSVHNRTGISQHNLHNNFLVVFGVYNYLFLVFII